MKYPTNMTNTQSALVRAILAAEPKRGPKHGRDLRRVVDAMLYVTHTGCQWGYLPADFGPWTRVWSQFRRWSDNGTFVPGEPSHRRWPAQGSGQASSSPNGSVGCGISPVSSLCAICAAWLRR